MKNDFPTTKRQAIHNGGYKYFTGRACKRGHLTFRYSISGACVSCIAHYSRASKLKRSISQRFKIILRLNHRDDIPALKAYALALDFQRASKDRDD